MEAAGARRATTRCSAVADAQDGRASHVVGVSWQEDSSDPANVYSPVLGLLKSYTRYSRNRSGTSALSATLYCVIKNGNSRRRCVVFTAIRRLVAVFVEGEHVVSEAITPRERHVFHHPR